MPPDAPTAAGVDRSTLLSLAMEQVGEGVAVFDNDDVLIYANPMFATMAGSTVAGVEGLQLRDLTAIAEEVLAQRDLDEAAGAEVTRREYTTLIPGLGVRTRQVTVSALRAADGARIGRVACILDVSGHKAVETQLQQAAWHDPLTSLPNRRLLFDRLDRALAAARRTGRPVAVLFVDLDSFKQVNDSHGHSVGDQLLLQVAHRLGRCVREADTLARLGGDEFVAVLVDVAADDDAQVTAVRMLRRLAEPFYIGDLTVEVTASIGVALTSSARAKGLLHAADLAMYEAKSAGPGRIHSSTI